MKTRLRLLVSKLAPLWLLLLAAGGVLFFMLLSERSNYRQVQFMTIQEEFLVAINRHRGDQKQPPLTWSNELENSAMSWAHHLAASGRREHSSNVGENIWYGTQGRYSPTDAINSWGAERQFFKPDGVVPDISTTGQFKDAGHYSAMVATVTTKVGCARASGGGFDIVVCHFDPPGNIYGQKVLK